MIQSRPKILVFIDWFLPGFRAGGPIRSCANMIDCFRDEFEFSVITRDRDYHESSPYPGIRPDQWSRLPDGTRVYYFSKNNLSINNISRILREEPCDKIYINGIFSFYFSILPAFLLRKKNKNIVVAVRGMLAQGALSVKRTKKNIFFLAAKMFGIFDRVLFHATSENERQDIIRHFGQKADIRVAPNLPCRHVLAAPLKKMKKKYFVRMVCISRISPEKNVKYALEVLKEVKENIVFDLFGTVNNEKYWEECQQVIRKLPRHVQVHYKGAISSPEVFQTLSDYHFLFLPTLGENFGHTLIESMMAGTPVIISDKTIWKGLISKKAGWDIPLDKKGEFINVVNFCAGMDDPEYQLWSKGALEYAGRYLSDPTPMEQNRRLLLNQ